MSIAFNPFSGQLTTQPDLLRLPNNARIGNTEHFYQTTKPTARGNGSALVVGDRWWKIDDGTEWFWNGTYWLSTNTFTYSYPTSRNSGSLALSRHSYRDATGPATNNFVNVFDGNFLPPVSPTGTYRCNLFTVGWTCNVIASGGQLNNDNYWLLNPSLIQGGAIYFSGATVDTRTQNIGGGQMTYFQPINSFWSTSWGTPSGARLYPQAIGDIDISVSFSIIVKLSFP